MSHVERWPERHPLCTCPAGLQGVDRSACAGGSIAHPVLTSEDFQAAMEIMKGGRDACKR